MPFVVGECCSLVRHEHKYEEDGEQLGLAPMRDPMLGSSCFGEEEELQTAPTGYTPLSPVLPSIAEQEEEVMAILQEIGPLRQQLEEPGLRIVAELRRFGLLP